MKLFKTFLLWRELFLLLASSLLAFAQSTDPVLKPFAGLTYPPLARTARIQGEVRVEFLINQDGNVVSVNLLSGHPMLTSIVTNTVQAWKFQMPKSAPQTEQRYETVFSFELDSTAFDGDEPYKVIVDSFRHVRILAEPVMIGGGSPAHSKDCPTEKDLEPPSEVSATDSVEMRRSGCHGGCQSYAVQVHADGRVEWNGETHVSVADKQNANISPMEARDLIEKFRGPDFWALCGTYTRAAINESTIILTVHLGKRTKVFSNYANSAPDWTADLENAVDNAADTHRWRHGDPLTEPLVHISDDADIPKPGVTPLMRAAANGEAKKIKELLDEGADVGQTDSSGWTALMYANPRECDGGGACISTPGMIKLLIAAGADVNYSSPHGDTPLMAAAFDRRFEKELVNAGAKINTQNLDGVSVLMILAAQAQSEEIEAALTAGADPKLRDYQGRTALDYLLLANCGKSPARDPLIQMNADDRNCKSLYEGDFEKSRDLLRKAMSAR